MEESSSDIPLKYDIILQFNVSKDAREQEKEERIKQGLRTYFSFVRSSLEAKIRDTYQKSGIYMLASFLLLFVSFSFQLETAGNTVLTTLVNGVNIVGWCSFGKPSQLLHSPAENPEKNSAIITV